MKLTKLLLLVAAIPFMASCNKVDANSLSNNRDGSGEAQVVEQEQEDLSSLTVSELLERMEALEAEEEKLFEDNEELLNKVLDALFGVEELEVDESEEELDADKFFSRHHHRDEEPENEEDWDFEWLDDEDYEYDFSEDYEWDFDDEDFEIDFDFDEEYEWDFDEDDYDYDFEYEWDYEEDVDYELTVEEIVNYVKETGKLSDEELVQFENFLNELERIYNEYEALYEALENRVSFLFEKLDALESELDAVKDVHADLWEKVDLDDAEDVISAYNELSDEEKALLDEDIEKINAIKEEAKAYEEELALLGLDNHHDNCGHGHDNGHGHSHEGHEGHQGHGHGHDGHGHHHDEEPESLEDEESDAE